jgi:hypothetical protein
MKNILVSMLVVMGLVIASSSFAKTKYWANIEDGALKDATLEQYNDLINNGEVIDISEFGETGFYKMLIKHPDYGLVFCFVGTPTHCHQAGDDRKIDFKK